MLNNKKILIVEDEALIAMDLADLVEELGYSPVGPALNVPRALELIGRHQVDAAIIGINVERIFSLDVADELLRLGKPFVFTTGYPAGVLPSRLTEIPIISKPFVRDAVAQKLLALTTQTESGSNN